ncbi:glycine oxidase ThiO [Virgibacillus sp. FSP13]
MKQPYDVIIVGGGVIGSSIAFQLSKRRYRVLVIEKDRTAKKASGAAAGMLGAQSELEENSPIFPIARKSRSMFPELADELKSLSGIDIELIQSGILKVAQTDEEITHLKSVAAFQQSMGEVAEWLTSVQVKEQEPALSDFALGGLFIPNDGQVNPPLFSKALAQSAAILGADFLEYTEVQDFVKENNRFVGVKTENDTFFADEIVVAGGAWSQQITEKAGLVLDTYPVKGECFSVRHYGRIVTSSIFLKNGYIVPKSGGRLIIGATQKPYSFDESVCLNGLSQLITNAMKVVPALKDAKWEKAWAGIRPQTGVGLPYMGKHPFIKGLSIATGHFRNGILLAPVTGLFMADLIEGKPVDDTFRIDRISLKEVKT